MHSAGFGVWSKYVPLSTVIQIGEVGILDSSCFHLFRIQDSKNNELHFIQYECVNFQEHTIKKYFLFFSNDGNDCKEEIIINNASYENIWYFQGFFTIPSQNMVSIYLYEQMTLIIQKQIQVQFLFEETNYDLIIGGDLKIINKNSQFQTVENKLLSYFPGQIYYLVDCYQYEPEFFIWIIESNNENSCLCEFSNISEIADVTIEKQDQFEFVAQKPNCQQFLLSGWIRIKEIISFEDEFYYQLFKLSGNFQNPQLTQENLCAFQLIYKISQLGNQIITKSYSYTFPTVNIDFSNNPFLKTEKFNIFCNIQLWHYILVEKRDTSISITITFYQGFDQQQFNTNFEVNQFNMVQFKLLYGNILQSKSNQLSIQIIGLKLINCPENNQPQINCHPTCKECDGPTKEDCLSCFESSNRIYLPDFKECICEYGTFDQNNQCINYQTLQLNLIQEKSFKEECQYGFFELNDECYKCPSIINSNVITCLECVQNPKLWAKTLLCQTTLYTDQNGNTSKYFDDIKLQYILIGNDLEYCPDCNSINQSYNQFDHIESIFKFKKLCQNTESIQNDCYFCSDECHKCQITATTLQCLDEDIMLQLQFISNKQICETPNFIDFYQKCVICKIQHCLYCFNYLVSDPTKTTLGFYESYSLIDEEIKVGCAQCIDGFIYEFKTGLCIYQKPSLINCLRSFINLENQEICTLSSVDDFSIAVEIINCQNHILNCKQCIQTMQQTLKCLICEDGYLVSSNTGVCIKCHILNTKQCFEENTLEPWKWLVQGFVIQFLPNTPIYNNFVFRPRFLVTKCIEGYQQIMNLCQRYCNQMCLNCEPIYNQVKFSCTKCKLNYYKEPIRVQVDGKCIQCSSLCQVCQDRSNEEIYIINPYFKITPDNLKYTFKCIQKIPLQQVYIDPNLKIAQFCYQNNCNYNFELYYDAIECNDLNYLYLYLEKYYNYQYFNEIGLKQITLTLQLQQDCSIYNSEYFIDNSYKENIFSMQLTRLIIQGTPNPIQLQTENFKLSIFQFDQIVFRNTKFQIQNELVLIFGIRDYLIDLKIHDTEFYSTTNTSVLISIQGYSFVNVNMDNLLIFNIRIENQVIFNIFSTDLNDDIKINNIQLRNCVFINSTLFLFQNFNRNIYIQNFTIDSCEFYNSSIINFNQIQNQLSKTIFNGIQIGKSIFQNTYFIYSIDKTMLTINNISIIQNKIINSKFIIFNYDFYCNNFIIMENHLISLFFISQISTQLINSTIKMNEIKIIGNIIQNFSLFITEQKQSTTQVSYLLQNLQFEDNIISCNQEYFLITINCFSLIIKNVFLKNTTNYRFISVLAVPFIRIENIIYENQYQEHKVKLQIDCFKNCISHSQLLQVSGFTNITLNQITIKNSFSIDQSIISIQSNPLFMVNTNEYIFIKNLKVMGNIILKQHLGIIFSLIELYSEKPQIIEITDIIFEENIFHQYNKDPSKTSASLLYVNSAQSLMILNNIICSNNTLTNSSQSYFSLFIMEIFINNFKVQNHNYVDNEIWTKYYEIHFQQYYNQNEISYVISKSFKIDNIGGILSTTVTKFTLYNGVFNHIIAQSSQAFIIILQGDGIVIIKNCSLTHAYTQLMSNHQNDGAFTINGKNSLLQINFDNITLIDVQNKLSSSIFSIYPSFTQNNFQLKNIIANNCFSLVHQIINFEADFQNAQQNKVLIQNLKIIQTEQGLKTFLQSIGKISLIEMQKVISDNSIMNFQGCELFINGIQIEGIILSSIIKILDSNLITLINSQFIDISTFYPLHLVEIQQNNILKSNIYINNVTMYNFNDFTLIKQNLAYFEYNHIGLDFTKCSLKSNYIVLKTHKKEYVDTFFDEIVFNSNYDGSLFKFKSTSNQTRVFLTKVLLLNNNCQMCRNGLLYFELIEIKQVQISELQCIQNSIKDYGCIWAKSDNMIQSQLLIEDSNFISNKGRQGSGILVQNLRFKLLNSKIINNTASYRGGGLYFEEGSQRLIIKSTIIINNQAEEGGGIYLSGNSSLNKNNFIKSLILFNFANLSSNNINELPQLLSLSINQKEMQSQKKIIGNHSFQVLELKPYKIISQDHSTLANYLLIPSGQQIQKYEIYNSKLKKYLSYITEFTIKLKNSLNEQQINFLNSTCNVKQLIVDIQTQNIIESTNISTISFDQQINRFNLGQLVFNIDPYKQEGKIQEILIYCQTEYQEESLAYRLQVNSLLCQLGEFYIFFGCQKCQSEQGFYSVTYNTTKCSIFDKNKFEAITSNKIQLKPGFWRPSYITDNVEFCYKNPYHCLGGWSVGDDLCFMGHIGGLCEECDRFNLRGDGQFFKDQQNLDCQQCQQLSKRLIAFFFISIWAILSTLLTIRSIEKTNQLYTQLKLRQNQKYAEILFKLQQDHQSILLKLFLNYLWIFSLIFTFNINFSISFNFVKQSNDTSYFMANYFDCFLAEIQGIELIYSRILVMLLLMVCQTLIIFIGFLLLSIIKRYKFQNRIISITVLYLYIQNYASLINQFFSILSIRKISNLNYIQGDVSLIYGSQSHVSWIYGFVIPGSFFIGLILPILLFLLLYINRDQHNKIKFRRHLGYLFNEYTQKSYFWEIIKLWKKTIIIVILVYFETDIFLRASLLGLWLLIYQFIALNSKPYILQKFNLLDIQSGQLCQMAIFLATVKYICEQQEKLNISFIIQTFIFLDSIILSYPFIINILNVYYKKYKLQILSLLFYTFNKIRPNFIVTKFIGNRLNLMRQRKEKSKTNILKLKQWLFSTTMHCMSPKYSSLLNNTHRGKQISITSVELNSQKIN
ncbi:unnamed protein product [Paramecium primaurelia]|uniref:Transmembrane protein n=1 Tax=Paramecium primaurelia TaxID=5886 RepID=A0A8S1N602_PARPR|nr:unnamed protein product [Paramecium primaurelia]